MACSHITCVTTRRRYEDINCFKKRQKVRFSGRNGFGIAIAFSLIGIQSSQSKEKFMINFKLGTAVAAIALMSFSTVAEAQSYSQLGTRRGAVAGAIIGGIIGDQNNEALAGAAIGGLVGAAAGRSIGRSKDARYYGNSYGGGYSSKAYQPQPNYYGGGYGGGGYGGGGYGGGVYARPVTPVYGSGYSYSQRSFYSSGYGGGGYGGGGYGGGYGGGGRGFGGGGSCPYSRGY